jgi:signal peptidase I
MTTPATPPATPDESPGLFRQLTRWPGVLVLVFIAAILLLILFLSLRLYAPVSNFKVSSAAMAPTLVSGDVVLVKGPRACLGATPEVGDVVLVRFPPQRTDYLRRVVAGAGDRVELRGGRLWLNDQPVRADKGAGQIVREVLPGGQAYDTLDAGASRLDVMAPVTLKPGQWFLLGDNRDNALDSRIRGPVTRLQICGVVTSILSSSDSSHVGKRP